VPRGSGTLDVFTFKAGVLAVAAHDLHLRLEGFTVSLDGEEVRAELPLERLRLLGPLERGVTVTDRYTAAQVAEVESAMRRDVLAVGEHPIALFTGHATGSGDLDVEGTLELAGKRAPLALRVGRHDGAYRGTVELRPSRWGIAQYRALLGAIRLQDRVRIEVTVREI
jgi:hypothetical protein